MLFVALPVSDLISLVQEYAHEADELADYSLSEFELCARFSKYRGLSWVSTSGAWMGSSVPREIPFAEIRITPHGESYDRRGVIVENAKNIQVELIFCESIKKIYTSEKLLLPITTKRDRERIIKTIFARGGYKRVMKKIRWKKMPGYCDPNQESVYLKDQFEVVFLVICRAIMKIRMRVRHTKMPVLICETNIT